MTAIEDVYQDMDSLKEKRGRESLFFIMLIDEIMELDPEYRDDLKKFEDRFHVYAYCEVIKHSSLQYDYKYEITSSLVPGLITLEIESGINNGTRLNSYSFTNSPENETDQHS